LHPLESAAFSRRTWGAAIRSSRLNDASALIVGLLGRKRGIFVLAANAIAKEHSIMNT